MTVKDHKRIETINGRYLVCGYIHPLDEIKVGQIWSPADGSDNEIVITKIDDHVVYYQYNNTPGEFFKDVFIFQIRFCMVVDNFEPVY